MIELFLFIFLIRSITRVSQSSFLRRAHEFCDCLVDDWISVN